MALENSRRAFLKKAAIVGSAATIGTVSALASTTDSSKYSGGVVVGKSKKKEILYKKTKEWELFYKTAN